MAKAPISKPETFLCQPFPWVKVVFLWISLTGSLVSLGCGPAPAVHAPRGQGPGGRPQELMLTPGEELELGQEAYQEVLGAPDKYGRALPAGRPEVKRVRGIARRIVQAAGIEPLQREINLRVAGYAFEWEVNVLENKQINAFCLPGGKMVVFTGILPVAQDDDQLATVMSHEISHALAHHASERLARGRRSGKGLFSLAYDRQQESEADHIGLFLMTFAGFNPDEAVNFWQRMQKATGTGGRIPEILSDHPSDEHRIEAMRQWVPNAKAAKRAYDEGRVAGAKAAER